MDSKTGMIYHQMNVTRDNRTLILEVEPLSPGFQYEIKIRKDKFPTSTKYHFEAILSDVDGDSLEALPYVIPQEAVEEEGTYYIAVKTVQQGKFI